MLHRRNLAAFSERHAQSLHRWRARAIETHIVRSRRDHFDWLADCLGGECNRHSVVAAKATGKAASKEISAHDDFVLTPAKRLGQPRQRQCLPLVSAVHLKHAVFLERETVDWLERTMHACA